jgi:uncharacterized protein DUF2867
VRRIVYLGGLAPDGVPVGELSQHLRSRVRGGEILRDGGVPTVELRAAVITGSGAASFEMLRYLTERLPVMVTPKWVRTKVQPIAVRDVLRYLVGAAAAPDNVVGNGGAYSSSLGAHPHPERRRRHPLGLGLPPRHPERTPPDRPGLDRRHRLRRRSHLPVQRTAARRLARRREHRRRDRLVLVPPGLDRTRLARPPQRRRRLGRGRRDPQTLRLGDTLDFWRVEAIDRGSFLRLRAEMKMPGLGWLEMRVAPDGHGHTRYTQRAVYLPHGLFGHLYWWSMKPFHSVIYRGMARNMARQARRT